MKILYATDDTAAARAAGRLLTRMVDPDLNEITVLSVAPVATPPAIGFDPASRDAEPLLKRAADIAEKEAARLSNAGLKATSLSSRGIPGAEIARQIELNGYDLTVLGAGNKTWLTRLLLGSVSTHVLHSSPSSVLIVHEAVPEGGAGVLFATDGSDDARVAENLLATLLEKNRSRVHVVSVGRPKLAVDMPIYGSHYPVQFSDDERALPHIRERAQRLADDARRRLGAAGLTVESADGTVGYPSVELLHEADSHGVDLIVVGSRGLGPIRRAMLGSVSDHMTRYARAALVARRNG